MIDRGLRLGARVQGEECERLDAVADLREGQQMAIAAKTVEEYLASLPEDRRTVINAVRQVILSNLPEGYAECIQYGMIAYVVPHSLYPAGYHCDPSKPLQFAALGAQKNHVALHLMTVYGDPGTEQWLRNAFKAAGKKLDMGKACVRFKKLADLPLDVIGQVIARVPVQAYIDRVEKVTKGAVKRKRR